MAKPTPFRSGCCTNDPDRWTRQVRYWDSTPCEGDVAHATYWWVCDDPRHDPWCEGGTCIGTDTESQWGHHNSSGQVVAFCQDCGRDVPATGNTMGVVTLLAHEVRTPEIASR